MTVRLRPELADLPAYTPGKTVPGAIKIASNETVHGPLPSVRACLACSVEWESQPESVLEPGLTAPTLQAEPPPAPRQSSGSRSARLAACARPWRSAPA